MKKTFTLMFTLCCAFLFVKAQVPNNDFEIWTNNEPSDWYTSIQNGYDSTIYQSTNAHGGQSCVHGVVALNSNGQIGGPQLTSATFANNFLGFPISSNFDSVRYYFKFNPVGGDMLIVSIGIHDASTATDIWLDQETFTTPVTSWTAVAKKIDYSQGGSATNFFIDFSVVDYMGSYDSLHVGTDFHIDDVILYNTTAAISNENSLGLTNVFPNPCNDVINLSLGKAINHVDYMLYELNGNVVNAESKRQNQTLTINTSGLLTGFYMLRVISDNRIQYFKIQKVN